MASTTRRWEQREEIFEEGKPPENSNAPATGEIPAHNEAKPAHISFPFKFPHQRPHGAANR